MSIDCLRWAFELQLGDLPCKSILIALANHADDRNWHCFPSLGRLAYVAGCSESTARRALKKLEFLGLIVRGRRKGRSDYFELISSWLPSDAVENGANLETLRKLGIDVLPNGYVAHPYQMAHWGVPTGPDTPSNWTADPCQADTLIIIEPESNLNKNRAVIASRMNAEEMAVLMGKQERQPKPYLRVVRGGR